MPLLVYIQEFYSYPIGLDGLCSMSLTSNISETDIVFKAKNFIYNQPQSYDITTSRAFQSIIAIVPNDSYIKDGFTTTLTVHVPKHRDHPFWLLDSTQSDEKLFDCENIQDTLTFQVTRWGPMPELSSFNATQRAMDIIQNIRVAVSNSTRLPSLMLQSLWRPSSLHCSVFRLGIQLNSMWKCGKLVGVAHTVDLVVNDIQNIVNSGTLPALSPALKYYQVYRYAVHTNFDIDVPLYRCETVPCRRLLVDRLT